MTQSTVVENVAVDLIKTAKGLLNKDGNVWTKTGVIIQSKGVCEGADVKEMQKKFYEIMETGSSEVPMNGLNRKGEKIPLRKDDGTVKWSAWQVTARVCQNANEIIKCIDNYDAETVFPKGKLLPRHAIVQLNKDAKAPENPIKAIERAVKAIEANLPKVAPTDKVALDVEIHKIIVAYGALNTLATPVAQAA